ncbi:HNH endonuclease signature motif containing protein [Paenibacillus melissococcoides]|uniref:HNH endonuclease signature motif containing protein n=1 Tax=Paenibacillus melissococcoides TaxID=2912268 RepID=UPI00290561D7|nr:HNH endonuclease signature motif containing protein [Paenibacillus melissococcoides]
MKMPPKPKRPCSKPGVPGVDDRTLLREAQGSSFTSDAKPLICQTIRTALAKIPGTVPRPPSAMCMRRVFKERGSFGCHVVDHIKPHKGDYNLFWDPENHQPMNKRCHDRKTAKEDGGFGHGLYNDCY